MIGEADSNTSIRMFANLLHRLSRTRLILLIEGRYAINIPDIIIYSDV